MAMGVESGVMGLQGAMVITVTSESSVGVQSEEEQDLGVGMGSTARATFLPE